MACPGCPNRFRGYEYMVAGKPGKATVALYPWGGLTCIFVTSDGLRGGTADYPPDKLDSRFKGLNDEIDLCESPLTTDEALKLGNLALDGACRPLATVVDVNSGDDVARVFAPDA